MWDVKVPDQQNDRAHSSFEEYEKISYILECVLNGEEQGQTPSRLI
jgi:hypothetical protein